MSSINKGNFPPLPAIPSQTTAEQAEQGAKNVPVTGRAPSKVEQEQAQRPAEAPRKASAGEAERAHSQTGFSRVPRKKGRGFDLEDATQAPIPLPVDEVDSSAWEQRSLDEAQEELTLQSHELKHLAAELAESGPGELGLFGKLVGRTFEPTAGDVQRLEALAEQPPATPVGLEQMNKSLETLFGINVTEVQSGPAMVAAALVVAGLSESVLPTADSLDANRLCEGMQKLVDRSNHAVEDARGMSSGINKQLAVHRTFMFKR